MMSAGGTVPAAKVLVVGAGIAGLTSAAILSKLGLSVTLIESHTQSGGCAGTFKRKNYVFDVGATQVAGLEIGGIHSKIFAFLKPFLLIVILIDVFTGPLIKFTASISVFP